MRTIVVDDEPWMLKRFSIECEQISDIELLGSFRSSLKALEFASQNKVELAFLDVEMPELNGLELAQKLKEINEETIVIFVTAYDKYIAEAFKAKTADYFIMKPYSSEDVEAAIDRARLMSGRMRKAIFARTFGVFGLFSDNKPVTFRDSKEAELFALLVDRDGGILSEKEAAEALWQQEVPEIGEINFHRTVKCLREDLAVFHIDDLIEKNNFGYFINTNLMDCDLYKFLAGDLQTVRQYADDYMIGYDWAAKRRKNLRKQSEKLGLSDGTHTQNSLYARIRITDNPELTISYMNDGFFSLVGYTRKEIEELFHNSFRAMVIRDDSDQAEATSRQLFESGNSAEIQYLLSGKDGREVWVICKSEPPKTKADDTREISCVLFDISNAKSEQNKHEQDEHCDKLTGLYKRDFAHEKIQQYFSSADPVPSCVLVIVDADDFQEVNEAYGHSFADTVLTDIAAILTRSFCSNAILCRLCDDEIVIFLKGIDSEEAARKKLASVSEALGKRLAAKTQGGELSCSFGGAVCPQNGCDFDTLYANASCAIKKAKEKKNCTVWYNEINAEEENI